MNAPITDTIRAEAAKSLLERMAEKTKLVRFFRYNASAKHGVPIDAEDPINFPAPTTEPAAPTPVVKPVDSVTPTPIVVQPIIQQPTPVCQNGLGEMLKGILATLAALAVIIASVLSGLAISNWNTEEKPTVQTPVEHVDPLYQESPFQYLEDQGEHLP